MRECGAKGCVLVEIEPERPAKMKFHPLDVCRWSICDIDATELDTMDDVVATLVQRVRQIANMSEDRTSIVRALISGQTHLQESLIARHEHWQSVMRQAMFEIDDAPVYMERLRVSATLPTLQRAASHSGPVGELIDTVREAARHPNLIDSISTSLGALYAKLPAELVENDDGQPWNGPENVERWIAEAEPLLMQRFGGEDSSMPNLEGSASVEDRA